MRAPRPVAMMLMLSLVLPALAACGTPRWGKAGSDKDAMRADLAECRARGEALVARDADIDSDILATRGRDWALSGSLAVKETGTAAADRGRAAHYVEDCMRAKGYTPAR